MLDVYPDGLLRLDLIKENGLLANVWRSFNRRVIRNAGKILVLGRDMKHWVREIEPSAEARTMYVPHWQNENLVCPREYAENEFVKKHDLTNRFVVQYSGYGTLE